MPAYKDTVRNTWYVKFSRNNKQILKRGFSTKKEALRYEANYIDDTTDDVTFQHIADAYYQYRDLTESTRYRQLSMIEKYVSFRDLRYSKLSKKVMMEWYLELQKNSLSIASKNLVLKIVKQVFRFGAEFYDLPNYSTSLKPFKNVKREMQTWTTEEFEQFISHVKLEYYRVFFIMLYWTGLREMECDNLLYTDIDDNRIHVRGTKTYSSDRYITIPDALLRILRPLLARCDEGHPFIFGGENPLPVASIFKIFKRSIREAGVKEIRIHDLRHSFATNAINNGCDIVAVSKYLGHSNISITLNVYTHLLDKTEKDMVEKLNEQFSVSKLYQTIQ